MMKLGHAPPSFGKSYTVPILKGGMSSHGKSVTVVDFRGIAIIALFCLTFSNTAYLCAIPTIFFLDFNDSHETTVGVGDMFPCRLRHSSRLRNVASRNSRHRHRMV